MRTLITILLFCVAVCSKSATQDDSNEETRGYWGFPLKTFIYGYGYNTDGSIVGEEFTVFAKEDSIVNGIKYEILDSEEFGRFLLRKEGSRIYRLSEDGQQEYLVFDYSLRVGDSFTDEYGIEMIVTERKDTVELDNWGFPATHILLRLESVEEPKIKDVWIDGVGSLNTGMLPRKSLTESYSYQVMYSFYFVGFLVNTPIFKSCPFFYDYGDRGEDFDADCRIEGDSLYIKGHIPLFCNDFQYISVSKNGDYFDVYFSRIPSLGDCYGPYKVNIALPGFRGCEGCKLKFWTAYGTYTYEVTGIDKVKGNSKEDGTVYDLTGRKLNGKPHKGIYIRNKKKHFGK